MSETNIAETNPNYPTFAEAIARISRRTVELAVLRKLVPSLELLSLPEVTGENAALYKAMLETWQDNIRATQNNLDTLGELVASGKVRPLPAPAPVEQPGQSDCLG